MATTILNKTKSTYGNPHAYYKVEVTGTSDRTANSVKVLLKITSNLSVSYASLGSGYTLKGYLYAGAGWSSAIAIKESSAKWSGTTEHVKNATVTISGLNSTQTKLTGVKFKVNSNAGDKACQLNETSCSNITIPSYHRNPGFTPNNVTLTEVNQAVINANLPDYTFALNLSIIRIDVSNVVYYDGADFARLELLEEKYAEVWEKVAQVTTNPGYYTPTKAFAWDDLWVRLYDTKGGSAFDENTAFVFHTIPYIKVTMDASTKRVGQTSGQVSISCEGKYYNGDVGNVPQGGTYKPVIKYKFWRYGTTEPQTYAYIVNPSNVTISDGTYRVSGLNIGSTDEHAPNYFNPKFAYRVKIQVNDNFTTQTSGDMSIPVGEPVWTEYKDRVDFKKLTIQGVEVTPGGGTGGDYDNLINKPSINSVTLSGDKTPAQLGFSTVATSGSYNDLSNKPTIPTVNNATLTIQKNGTTVNTFTANASSNVTANIIVPTKTSDLTNDDNVVKDASYVHTDNNYTTTEKNKLSGIASGAEVNVQSNWNETNTSSDAYIQNKPTIPTVNNGTLTIQKNGTNVQTFSANQSGNATANITVPTKTSELTNNSGFITKSVNNLDNYTLSSSLKAVATSGSYNDLTNKPTIPTVNNGTLTIQKNGTNVQTFTANQSSNVTANITVPTKTSELTNDSNYLVNANNYVNIHPENSPVIIPFINNDIAYLNQRGGSYIVKYDGTTQSQNIDNVFDASPSYWAINPTGTTEIIIELTLHKSFTWTNSIYYDFGSASWRAKNIKVEVMNSNYASDTWVVKQNLTNYGKGNGFVTTSHTPVGASNAGAGFNKIRFTFSGWQTATGFRIAQLGVYNYGSLGVRETYMSRGRDDYLYRNITPNANNTYKLGASDKKWNNIYATTFTGALSGTASFTGNVNFNKNEAQNFAVQRLSTAPASPVNGQLYYDTNYGTVYVYANGGWVDVLATSEPTENYNQLFNRPITNLEGTSTEPLILANLSHGTYRIMGEYKYDSSDTTKSTDGALVLVFGSDSETRRIIFGEGGVIIGNGTIESGKFKSLLPIVTTSSMTANSTVINGWKTELIDGVLVEYYGG